MTKRIVKYIMIFRNILKYSFYSSKIYFRGREKSNLRIFYDLLIYFVKTGEFNSYYYAYGLNVKDSNSADYIGKKEMNKLISIYNKKLRIKCGINDDIGCDIITKDKFYLTSLLNEHNIPVIQNVSLVSAGKIINSNGEEYELEKIFDYDFPIIIKNTILEYNEGILFIEKETHNHFINNDVIGNREYLYPKLIFGNWIIQNVVQSSTQIRRINDTALNTTRIVTIYGKSGPEYLAGFQAFATNQQKTDSWGKGSVYVGFNRETETLEKNGFFHPDIQNAGLVTEHPDSKIEFEGYKIPGLSDAVKMCIKAHRYLYYMFLIGWDVAITDDGPKILEANEKPGMNAVQCVSGGLREKLNNIQI